MRLFLLAIACFVAACSTTSDDGASPGPAAPAPSGDPSADAPPAPPPNALAQGVDALFADAASKDTFAGSVVVVDGGVNVLEKGYGPADRDSKRANATDTIYRVGSVSKQFTAAAILTLVEDGKLAVTDPVSKFFPEYPAENLTKDGVAVTLHYLLSQESGLPDPEQTDFFRNSLWKKPMATADFLGAADVLPMTAKPGDAFAYLNYNYFLLALVVERVSGQAYEAYLRDKIWAPLEMTDTGTILPADKQERAAVGYSSSNGVFTALSEEVGYGDPDVTHAFGAGQIYSTVQDLAKWDRALAAGKILPTTRDLLFKPNLGSYGYGYVIQQKSGVTYEWHNGALSPLGFSAMLVRVPSKDRFVAYLSNLDIDMIQPFETKVVTLAVK